MTEKEKWTLFYVQLRRSVDYGSAYNTSVTPLQVLLDGSVIYRTNSAMKKGTWKNIHYIDQKELWKVVIKLDKPNQVPLTSV